VILAHAELIETKRLDDATTKSVSQVVAGALGAMDTVKALRETVERLQP
jgi:predicted dinucleotide-utilizing enzyme